MHWAAWISPTPTSFRKTSGKAALLAIIFPLLLPSSENPRAQGEERPQQAGPFPKYTSPRDSVPSTLCHWMAKALDSLCLDKSFQGPINQSGYMVCTDSFTTIWCFECSWPLNNRSLNSLGSFICGIFSNKYSWRLYPQVPHPQIQPNYWLRTVSSHLQVRIPNCRSKILFWIHSWLNPRMWRASFSESNILFRFSSVWGSLPQLFPPSVPLIPSPPLIVPKWTNFQNHSLDFRNQWH